MQQRIGTSSRIHQFVSIILAVVVVALALPGFAEEPRAEQSREAMIAERIQAGDLKYRDPKSGEVVVATQERIDALRFSLEQYFGQPAVFNGREAADGTVSSVIGDAVRDVMLVRINLDGTRTKACLRDLDAAVAFVVGLDTVESKVVAKSAAPVSR